MQNSHDEYLAFAYSNYIIAPHSIVCNNYTIYKKKISPIGCFELKNVRIYDNILTWGVLYAEYYELQTK